MLFNVVLVAAVWPGFAIVGILHHEGWGGWGVLAAMVKASQDSIVFWEKVEGHQATFKYYIPPPVCIRPITTYELHSQCFPVLLSDPDMNTCDICLTSRPMVQQHTAFRHYIRNLDPQPFPSPVTNADMTIIWLALHSDSVDQA